ncbi:MAG: arylsulfatase [Verrucomicrobiae bacterium]|nr:arylsulfatase [Verrucomicrobiae bacterium]
MKLKSLLAFSAFLLAPWPGAGSRAETPNIVLVYADDIGYGDLGCYGAKTIPTPAVDRLAREGLRFTSAYASSATCTPSRYSMLTGQYAFRRPGTGIAPPNATALIQPGRLTLASLLKQAGYATAVVGKWHLGLGDPPKPAWSGDIKPGPLEIGFDYCFLMPTTGDRVPCVYVENHRVVNLDPDDPIDVSDKNPDGQPTGESDRATLKLDWSHGHNCTIVNGISRIGFMTGGLRARWTDETMADTFTEKALAFIGRSAKAPFFLFFSTHGIHVPRAPNPRFAHKTPHGPRGDALVEFDDCVGRILAQLDALNIAQNTLVILSSDNGPVLDDGYKDDANEKRGGHDPAGGLRGGKYSIFEGGTRMPFIVRWPGRVKPGVSDAIVGQIDLIASLAALTGQTIPQDAAPDSLNLLPALLGESTAGRPHIIQHANALAIRQGDWKFIPPGGRTRDKLGPWDEVAIPDTGFLFNLANDKGETRNLASEHPDRVSQMKELLEKVRASGRSRP